MKITNEDPCNSEVKSSRVFWKRFDFWDILLLLAAAASFYQDSLREIWEGIGQISRRELSVSILLSLAAYFLEGVTIACMMSAVTPSFSLKKGTAVAYLCEFYRLVTLGSGSGFAEIYYLCRNGIETGTATVLTMLQYVCKRAAVLLLGSLGFALLSWGYGVPESGRDIFREYAVFMAAGCVIGVAVIAAFLCIILSDKIARVILCLLELLCVRVPSLEKKTRAWQEQVLLLNGTGKDMLARKRIIAHVILLQIGKLLLFYLIPAYLLHGKVSFGAGGLTDGLQAGRAEWVVCMLLMAVVYMLSGIIPTPSGAGSLEFVFLLFFTRFVKTQTALPVILVFRFATWIVPFLIGGAVKIVESNTQGYCSRPGRHS